MTVTAGDLDRLFLQAVLSRGILSGKLAQTLWAKCADAVNAANPELRVQCSKDRDGWDAFVAKINKSIDKLDLEFRHLHDETSGREMYGLVNRKDDAVAQMATDYTPAEIAYFKAIVEQIVLAPREAFSVSSLAALREVSAIKPKSNMSKTQAEVVLGSFVGKGWLLKSKRGRYSLSTRSLLELLPYLKSTYPDEIIECTICMEILTRGVACYTENCKTRMHYHCFTTFRRRHSTCPSCNKDWPREAKDKQLVQVGEDAARDGDEGRRRVRIRSADPSDEEDEDEEEDPSQTQTQGREPKNTRRQSKKGEAIEDDMDVDEDEDEDEDSQPKATQRRRSSRR